MQSLTLIWRTNIMRKYELLNAIYDTTYHQIVKLLEEGALSAEYPIFNDWYIKWGKNDDDESDNIWNLQIWLYNGDTYIDCFTPFSYCETYAELAKGEVDCVAAVTDDIVDKIYKIEDKKEN